MLRRSGGSAGTNHGDRRLRTDSRTTRRRAGSVGTALLDVRVGPGGADAVAGGRRRDATLLQESAESAGADDLRQIDGGGGGSVRARDAALRQAGMGHYLDADRRRARAGAHQLRVGAAVLQAPAFRA